jgi:hypothetical protein
MQIRTPDLLLPPTAIIPARDGEQARRTAGRSY